MTIFFDLHRHDECSFFDGFGSPKDLAKIAKDLGYPALGTSNHGNITNFVRHCKACEAEGIKPVLGCEVYFQPKFDKQTPSRVSYHLCLFVKNYEGYKNLCHMLTEANREKFYYKVIIDLELLEKYHDGLICTTACVGSATSQAILHGNHRTAKRLISRLKGIFGFDLYVEIIPYKVDEEGTQEKVNVDMIKIADMYDIKCILTSDSHYGKKEDFETYEIMHEIGKTNLDVRKTYAERYMPSEEEIAQRFVKMHKKDYGENARLLARSFLYNMKFIYESVEDNVLLGCKEHLPKMMKEGLREKGKYTREYVDRCRMELKVIHGHKFDDYFLMVQDYVNFARSKGIEVGHGRGSACNCLVAYALGITEVDSIKYDLDFSRFMRADKKKLPDIDVDFETDRRQEVIDYVVKKYKGKAVQICSYSEYTLDALVNDLAMPCGFPDTGKDVDEWEKERNKGIKARIKGHIKAFIIDGVLNTERLRKDKDSMDFNSQYRNVIEHFCRMYGKVRHLGKHAAGVAVVGTDISDYTAVVRSGDMFRSSYDLNDLEMINCTKFDMLGLRTLSEIKELRTYSGHRVIDEDREKPVLYEHFCEGDTDGIFQLERSTPKKILSMIQCDCIDDVIATNALNRPAPLQLKMHETYAHNKIKGKVDKDTPFYQCTKDTYGTMLYQEQTVNVAQTVGHLTAAQSFDMLKIMKKPENLVSDKFIPIIEQMKTDFFEGCRIEGISDAQAKEIWGSMLIYGFNKGHSVGYSLISVDQMYYKVFYPAVFWYVKMKYAPKESDLHKFSHLAIKAGVLVMLPHVNYTALTSFRKEGGEDVIQQGLLIVKNVGEKAAVQIEAERKKNGVFRSVEDFIGRCQGRSVNKRVIAALEECGALEFNQRKYEKRVIKYNSAWLVRD